MPTYMKIVVFGMVAAVAFLLWFVLAMPAPIMAQFNDTSPRHVTLAWDANIEPDLDGYEVHYGTNPNALNMVADVRNTTTTVIGLPDVDKTYFFEVRAYDRAHTLSAPSNVVSVQGTIPVPTIHAPAPPRTVIITKG